MKTPRFPIYRQQVADHHNLPLFLHSRTNMSSTVRFGFTLDVHETVLALTVHVYFVKIWLSFFSFYNSTFPCIVEFAGHSFVI